MSDQWWCITWTDNGLAPNRWQGSHYLNHGDFGPQYVNVSLILPLNFRALSPNIDWCCMIKPWLSMNGGAATSMHSGAIVSLCMCGPNGFQQHSWKLHPLSKITCPELVPKYSRCQCDLLMDGHLRNVDNIKSGKWCQSAHPCEITELALHLLPENSYCINPDRQGISLIDCPAMNPWGYFTHYSGRLIWDHEPAPKVEHAAPYDFSSTGIASFCQKTIMISLDFTLPTLNLLYKKIKQTNLGVVGICFIRIKVAWCIITIIIMVHTAGLAILLIFPSVYF